MAQTPYAVESVNQPNLHNLPTHFSKIQTSNSSIGSIGKVASYPYEERGLFLEYKVKGFDNSGSPGGTAIGHNFSCPDHLISSSIGVQKSWELTDDLLQIASQLDDHPRVHYSSKAVLAKTEEFSLKSVAASAWESLAGACVLLPDHNVYLCITRVFHREIGVWNPVLSFMRGRIFSRSWVHMENYILEWKDKKISFPRIFDFDDAQFKDEGVWFGPEDPRVFMEQTKDAEPLVIFNMQSESPSWKGERRPMWMFRPLSGLSTVLDIPGAGQGVEKNWVPFFLNEPGPEPSKFIHFIYSLHPIRVIRCGIADGICVSIFSEDVPKTLATSHDNENSALRGGTQFLRVPLFDGDSPFTKDGVQVFFAIHRTAAMNTKLCHQTVYRPKLVLMATNGTEFYFTYVSESLDFGVGTIFNESVLTEPCSDGKIMIPNGIADWEFNVQTAYSNDTDVMTVNMNLQDTSSQVFRISGILKLIRALPSTKRLIENPTIGFGDQDQLNGTENVFTRHSAVSADLRGCAEESARKYVDFHMADSKDMKNKGVEAKKQEEEEKKKKEEEEKKIKEEEEKKKVEGEAKRKKEEDAKKKAEEEKIKKKEEEEAKKNKEEEESSKSADKESPRVSVVPEEAKTGVKTLDDARLMKDKELTPKEKEEILAKKIAALTKEEKELADKNNGKEEEPSRDQADVDALMDLKAGAQKETDWISY
ncbi:glycosyltransferase family 91 protein [Myriangium duriaei CBS 260.36]|uniref:Glycosyltransferase family 91 protein n=1 Tax=Myriangium duriaei CBS 260.36 TaxID=1168546 RepID=A0A9P4J2F3_9PEZI|nr:glycosyltransferase family 91 protein [Myriangium duriaei CBS 260.36]